MSDHRGQLFRRWRASCLRRFMRRIGRAWKRWDGPVNSAHLLQLVGAAPPNPTVSGFHACPQSDATVHTCDLLDSELDGECRVLSTPHASSFAMLARALLLAEEGLRRPLGSTLLEPVRRVFEMLQVGGVVSCTDIVLALQTLGGLRCWSDLQGLRIQWPGKAAPVHRQKVEAAFKSLSRAGEVTRAVVLEAVRDSVEFGELLGLHVFRDDAGCQDTNPCDDQSSSVVTWEEFVCLFEGDSRHGGESDDGTSPDLGASCEASDQVPAGVQWDQFVSLVVSQKIDPETATETLQTLESLVCLLEHVAGDDTDRCSETAFVRAMEMFGLGVEDVSDAMSACERPGSTAMGTTMRFVLLSPPTPVVEMLGHLQRCREFFGLFDEDGSGEITASELGDTLAVLFRRRPTKYEMAQLVGMVDSDGSGLIDFAEFTQMIQMKPMGKTARVTLETVVKPLNGLFSEWLVMCVGRRTPMMRPTVDTETLTALMQCLDNPDYDEITIGVMTTTIASAGGVISFADFARASCGPSTKSWEHWKNHVAQLHKLFRLFDTDNSGGIDGSELEIVLGRLQVPCTSAQLDSLLQEIDYTHSGSIRFPDFVRMLAGSQTELQRLVRQQILGFRHEFSLFDEDGAGQITAGRLKESMYMFGDTVASIAEGCISQKFPSENRIDFVDYAGLMTSPDPDIQQHVRSCIVSYREMFALFDKERLGYITVENCNRANKLLGAAFRPEKVFEVADLNRNGVVEFSEFVRIIAGGLKPGMDLMLREFVSRIDDIRRTFCHFDKDGSGYLDVEELQAAFSAIGIEHSEDQITELIKTIDENSDGLIDFAEFMTLFEGQRGGASMNLDEGPLDDTALVHELEELLKRSATVHGRSPEMITRLAELLRQVPTLSCIPEEMLLYMCKAVLLVEIKPGVIVARADKPQEWLDLVVSGEAHVWRKNPHWEEVHRSGCVCDGLWGLVRPELQSLLETLKSSLESIPAMASASCSKLVAHLDTIFQVAENLQMLCTKTMVDEMDDVATASEAIMEAGKEMCLTFDGLAEEVEQVRQQQLLCFVDLQLANQDTTNVERVLQIVKSLSFQGGAAIAKLRGAFSGESRKPLEEGVVHFPYDSAACLPFDDSVFGKHVGTWKAPRAYGTRMLAEDSDDTPLVWPTTVTTSSSGPGLKVVRFMKDRWQEAKLRAPLQFLKSIRVAMTEPELRKLGASLRLVHLPSGANLVQEGDVASSMYLIKSGELRVYKQLGPQPAGSKRLKEVADIGVGDVVDEVEWEPERSEWIHCSTVRASGDAQVYRLPRSCLGEGEGLFGKLSKCRSKMRAERHAVAEELRIPLSGLKPGLQRATTSHSIKTDATLTRLLAATKLSPTAPLGELKRFQQATPHTFQGVGEHYRAATRSENRVLPPSYYGKQLQRGVEANVGLEGKITAQAARLAGVSQHLICLCGNYLQPSDVNMVCSECRKEAAKCAQRRVSSVLSHMAELGQEETEDEEIIDEETKQATHTTRDGVKKALKRMEGEVTKKPAPLPAFVSPEMREMEERLAKRRKQRQVALGTMDRMIQNDLDSWTAPDEPWQERAMIWDQGGLSQMFVPRGRDFANSSALDLGATDIPLAAHKRVLQQKILSSQGRRKELAFHYGEGPANRNRLDAIRHLAEFSHASRLPPLERPSVRELYPPDQQFQIQLTNEGSLRMKTVHGQRPRGTLSSTM